MHIDGYIALAGLIVGFAVGLTGMGGGALMTPVLVIVFGIQPLAAVSSDLVASLIMKPVGAAVHAGRHTVRWGLVRWLALGSVPGALLGVVFLKTLGAGSKVESVVQLALGSVLLLSVLALGAKWLIDRRARSSVARPQEAQPLRVRRAATVAIGAFVGFVVGITATGSGTLVIVCLLIIYPRLRGSETVGTDLAQAVPMVGAAALGHILFGDFKLGLTLSIVAGSIPGVLLGSTVSSRAGTGLIRGALSVVLVASGLKLVNVPTVVIGVVVAIAIVAVVSGALFSRYAARQQAVAEAA